MTYSPLAFHPNVHGQSPPHTTTRVVSLKGLIAGWGCRDARLCGNSFGRAHKLLIQLAFEKTSKSVAAAHVRRLEKLGKGWRGSEFGKIAPDGDLDLEAAPHHDVVHDGSHYQG